MICEFLLPLLYIFDLLILKRLLRKKKVHPFPPHWVEVLFVMSHHLHNQWFIDTEWQTSLPNKIKEGVGDG